MDWKSLIKTIAPGIGACLPLPPPLGSMALKAIADKLLPADKAATATEDDVRRAVEGATPEQLALVKSHDQEFALNMKRLNVDVYKLDVEDTQGARGMFAATRSKMVPALAILAVVCFLAIGIYVLVWVDPVKGAAVMSIAMYLLGKWDSKVDMVYHFFFGSSSGSEKKTEILAQQGQA